MTSQEEALVSLARRLDQHHIPYMIIGGLANAVWGEPRATLDIDATISADTSDANRIASLLSRPEILQNWSRWKAGLQK